MSKSKKRSHMGAHKYQRIRWKSAKSDEPYYIFKCMVPGCNHHVPKDLVIGNETVCWRCGHTFQMNYSHTYLAKPHCADCKKERVPAHKEVDLTLIEQNLQRLLDGDI